MTVLDLPWRGLSAVRRALVGADAASDPHAALIERCLAAAAAPAAAGVFTRLTPDLARRAAREADAAQRAGRALGPLAGLPVTVKDLYDLAGQPTPAGSRFDDEPPALEDAVAVRRLKAAGAAILGRTNMSEFAFSGVGLNPHHGTPVNPADTAVPRLPGGSSSGAAVSLALGLAVAALGSDTGGSIRIPAALCGLVGFKPTADRVPRDGTLELSRSLDTVCALTRSVADAVQVDAVIADHPLHVMARPLAGLRFAAVRTLVLDGADDAVSRAYERALSRLATAGATIVELDVPEFGETASLATPASFAAIEGYAVHRERLAADPSRFDARVAQRLLTGAQVSAADYLRLQDRRAAWIPRVERRLAGVDAWLAPTVPIVAPPIAEVDASDAAFFATNALLLRNTALTNLLDGCSFSLPCHDDGELPVGLMLSSFHGADAALASIALSAEAALRPAA